MIENLPVEIVEHIFNYLDCVSAVRASGINYLWRGVFCRLVKYMDFFQKRCLSDISPESLLSIIDRIHPNCQFIDSDECIDWERVYKCWYNSYNIRNCTGLEKFVLEEYVSKITCVKVSGNWLFYGTSQGTLGMVNIEKEEEAMIYSCGHEISDIHLICSTNSQKNGSELSHNKIHCCMRDPSRILTLNIDCVKGFNNSRIIYEGSSLRPIICTIQWIKSLKRNYCLKMKSLGFNVSYIDTTLPSKVNDVVYVRKPPFYEGDEVMGHWCQLSANVTFAVGLIPHHLIMFSIGSDTKVHIIRPEMYFITCAFIYTNMLFIGNSNGKIFLYVLQDDWDVRYLDIGNYRSYELQSKDRIVGLDIHISKENIPSLVVATECALYTITFDTDVD